MKTLGIFCLILTMMVQAFSTSFIVLDFAMNRSSIIENFCVNKEKPELKCDGKCHLKKQIDQDTENKSEDPVERTETPPIVLTIDYSEKAVLNIASFSTELATPYRQVQYSAALHSVFHPPRG